MLILRVWKGSGTLRKADGRALNDFALIF
jgi:hypothetical protein